MHLLNCGSLRVPILGLIVSLGIDIELGQEVLDITLVLDDQKAILGVLTEVQMYLSYYSTY